MLTGAGLRVAVLFACAAVLTGAAEARTVTWARSGDALTLDPHALNEGVTHALAHQIYEPLIIRDSQGKPLPALAESWELTADPTVWEFKLRSGVKFHDGRPFTADDVIFSFKRALQPASDMKQLLSSVDELIKVDDHTLRIKTKGPNPLLPANLTDLFIMSKGWAEEHGATKVQDVENGEQSFAALNANGTGPFVLVSREPGQKTVLRRNDTYWGRGQVPLEISELIYLPIQSDEKRIEALLSGEVDFVQDVPVQDIKRLQEDDGVRVVVGPENRSIFLGLNVGDAELATSDVKGKNPFADKRVRHAINMAVNRQAIQREVMHGQSIPTGIIVPPGVNGYSKELDVIPPNDIETAKALMAEAGYPDGFSVTLNCPNDRYVNDEAICKAVVEQLAQIGIKAQLVALPKAAHFQLIQNLKSDFYLLGWGVPTFDSHYILSHLYHTKTDRQGTWNGTRYSNPDVDNMIDSLTSEADLVRRNETMVNIWRILQEETIYIPIHIQTMTYAMKPDLEIAVDISNQPKLKLMKVRKSN
jgi:peptide/nickel transport system substrate-binding protein|nr:MAG: peptide ABC transporter substrate-binding protein [Pseudomonadota bacterium]